MKKELMKMKKKLLILTAVIILSVTTGCGKKDNANSNLDVSGNYAAGVSNNVDMDKLDGDKLHTADDRNDSATLEETAVSIEDAKVIEDEGRKLFIVSYKFTNKSDNAESFTSLMKSDAYQDGMSMARALVKSEIEGFEPDSTAEIIDAGKTITVQEAYVLTNETAPVEVVVKEFHSESGVSVSKTFNL